jgi:hypothetical protein
VGNKVLTVRNVLAACPCLQLDLFATGPVCNVVVVHGSIIAWTVSVTNDRA